MGVRFNAFGTGRTAQQAFQAVQAQDTRNRYGATVPTQFTVTTEVNQPIELPDAIVLGDQLIASGDKRVRDAVAAIPASYEGRTGWLFVSRIETTTRKVKVAA